MAYRYPILKAGAGATLTNPRRRGRRNPLTEVERADARRMSADALRVSRDYKRKGAPLPAQYQRGWAYGMKAAASTFSVRRRRNASGASGQGTPAFCRRLVDVIRPGDLVTITNRFGQPRRGRVVMRSDPQYGPGWVLNMGGPHGTPGLANAENIVKVQPSKARHGGGSVPPQPRGNPRRHGKTLALTAGGELGTRRTDYVARLMASGVTRAKAEQAWVRFVRKFGPKYALQPRRKNPLTKREAAQAADWIGHRQRDASSARGPLDAHYLQGRVDGMADVAHAFRPHAGALDPRGPRSRRGNPTRVPAAAAPFIKRWIVGKGAKSARHQALDGQTYLVVMGPDGQRASVVSEAEHRDPDHHTHGWPIVSRHRPPKGHKPPMYPSSVRPTWNPRRKRVGERGWKLPGARQNPPPVLVTLNPSETPTKATALWRKFHGPEARGNGNPKVTHARGGSGNGRATIIHLGAAKELKLRGRPVMRLRGYTAYASPNGRRTFLAVGVPKFGASATFLDMGEFVTYLGPRYSRSKRPGGQPTWWKHKFSGGVRVFRTAGSNPTFVIEGGRFRVTDWMRG